MTINDHFDIPAVGGEPVAHYSESAGPVSILGAVDTPQPGSDLEIQAITKQKRELSHWNLADLMVLCMDSKCQVNMGTCLVLLIALTWTGLEYVAAALSRLNKQRRKAFLKEASKQFQAQMLKKTAPKSWGHSEEAVKRFAEAMQEV